MRVIKLLINTNIYIALAAVMLTVGTQVQLGLKPAFHYYLLLIFFFTVIDYNWHRIVKLTFSKSTITKEKHFWAFKNIKSLYITIALSLIGLVVTLFYIEKHVILWVLPFILLAIFYSMPPKIRGKKMPNLRKVPRLKIFIISITWAASTILLPVSQMDYHATVFHVVLMFIERFLFIFSITLNFDIRDMLEDYKSGIRTIPIIYGKRKSKMLSNVIMIITLIISCQHYLQRQEYAITIAIVISMLTTLFCLNYKKIRKSGVYYYGILDGTILLQGILLVLSFYTPIQ